VALTGVLGLSAFASPDDGVKGTRDAFRGSCWDVKGFMMAPHVDLDVDAALALCAKYGAQESEECGRGVAWAVGFFGAERFMDEERGEPHAACAELKAPGRSECLRGVGWGLSSAAGGDVSEGAKLAGMCDGVWPEEDAQWCWRGVGFPVGDHLGSSPQRLRRALEDFPPERRQDIAEGAGALVGRTYESEETIRALCSAWGEDIAESCWKGAQGSLGWRR